MSAFGGKADVIQGVAQCPLLAISGLRTRVRGPRISENGVYGKQFFFVPSLFHALDGHPVGVFCSLACVIQRQLEKLSLWYVNLFPLTELLILIHGHEDKRMHPVGWKVRP